MPLTLPEPASAACLRVQDLLHADVPFYQRGIRVSVSRTVAVLQGWVNNNSPFTASVVLQTSFVFPTTLLCKS